MRGAHAPAEEVARRQPGPHAQRGRPPEGLRPLELPGGRVAAGHGSRPADTAGGGATRGKAQAGCQPAGLGWGMGGGQRRPACRWQEHFVGPCPKARSRVCVGPGAGSMSGPDPGMRRPRGRDCMGMGRLVAGRADTGIVHVSRKRSCTCLCVRQARARARVRACVPVRVRACECSRVHVRVFGWCRAGVRDLKRLLDDSPALIPSPQPRACGFLNSPATSATPSPLRTRRCVQVLMRSVCARSIETGPRGSAMQIFEHEFK
jgi:hypothetical protein